MPDTGRTEPQAKLTQIRQGRSPGILGEHPTPEQAKLIQIRQWEIPAQHDSRVHLPPSHDG
jgi:hypothetical protein